MKFATIVAAAGVANAAKSDFPSQDSFHAYCAMTHTIKQDCQNVYPVIESTIKNGFADPSKGDYALKEDGLNDYVWATRTTPVKKYVDDVLFEFVSSSEGCQVNMKSKSETLSYYDYSTNYCNMYNVIRETFGVTFGDVTVSNCKFPASDLATCDTY